MTKDIHAEGAVLLPHELTSSAFPLTAALVPLFLDDGKRLQHVASGVAIRLANDELFILTAAHVTDLITYGVLCLPTTAGITGIKGGYGGVRLARATMRNADRDDIAYLRLDAAFAATLDPRIRPLAREDVRLHETLVEDDVYTFGGYPASKSTTTRSDYFTETFLYTGGAAAPIKYQSLGCNPLTHIIVNFNLKTSRSPDGVQQAPPHPKGISGGGVFAWRKDWQERRLGAGGGHLVAIGHTYLKQHHCLIGTRIHLHLALIARAFPHLVDEQELLEESTAIPMFMTLIWYPREEWELMRAEFVDADKYPLKWNEWRQRAETGLEAVGMRGSLMIPIELSRTEIADFCHRQQLPNDSQARLTLANHKLMRQIRGGEL